MNQNMGRPAKPYTLKLRGSIYSAKLASWKTPKSTGCKRKSDADRVAIEWLKEEERITKAFKENRYKLKAFAQDFFLESSEYVINDRVKGERLSVSHLKNRQALLSNYILPKLGDYKLLDITAVEVDKWLLQLELSNQTKNHIIATLKTILDYAVYKGKISINPISSIKKYINNPKIRDFFTKEELDHLFPQQNYEEAIRIWDRDKWLSFFSLLAYSGVRSGELRALRWNDIKTEGEKHFFPINKSVKNDGSIGSTKTGHIGVGYIPEHVYQWLMIYKGNVDPDDYSLIFTKENSLYPMTNRSPQFAFRRALKRAKIDFKDRNLVIHSFRHSFISILRNNQISADVIQISSQHTNQRTMDRYTHDTTENMIRTYSSHTEDIEKALIG